MNAMNALTFDACSLNHAVVAVKERLKSNSSDSPF